MIGTYQLGMALVCSAFIAGCSALPSSGPLTNDVIDQSNADASQPDSERDYLVADIDRKVLDTLKAEASPSLFDTFGDTRSPAQGTIRAGDQVAVTIWETGPGGLFSGSVAVGGAAPAQTTQIPPQMVATDGTILVPYAGRVKVSEVVPPGAQSLIQDRLNGTAAQPQVLITVTQSVADQITVSGDDIKGGLIPLATSGDRILDVIALAGGIQSPVYAAWVQLVRDGVSVIEPLQNIVQTLRDNIVLHPGDNLIVSKNPEFFTVLGASGKSLKISFDAEQVSLTEALGLAGGLLDERADPAGVFVFRYESRQTAAQLCGSCRFTDDATLVPVVYRLNMRRSMSLFNAQSFRMTNHDVLYIANAQQVQVEKVLAVVRDFLSPLLTGAVVDRAVNR